MSPALNGSSALEIKIHNRIMFHFYPGLPTNSSYTLSAHFKPTISSLVFNADFLFSMDVISVSGFLQSSYAL